MPTTQLEFTKHMLEYLFGLGRFAYIEEFWHKQCGIVVWLFQ